MLPSLTKDWRDVGQSDTYLQYEENTNKSREMSIDSTVFKSTLVAPIGEHLLSFGVEGKHESLEDKPPTKFHLARISKTLNGRDLLKMNGRSQSNSA